MRDNLFVSHLKLNFMDKKTLYVVIADPWNEDDDLVICSICDRKSLADSICEDVSLMDNNSFRRVYVSEYTLNCFEAW